MINPSAQSSGGAAKIVLAKGGSGGSGVYEKPPDWPKAIARILLTLLIAGAIFLALLVLQDWIVYPCDPTEPTNSTTCQAIRQRNTIVSATLGFVRIAVVVVALLVVMHHTGVKTTTLFTFAGILSLVVGLAAQSMLRDLFAGSMFLMEKQLLVGDYVHLVISGINGGSSSSGSASDMNMTAVGSSFGSGARSTSGISGIVDSVSMRRVKLRNFDNEIIYVPNASIQAVINSSQTYPVIRMRVQMSRRAEVERVLEVVRQTCDALAEDVTLQGFMPKTRDEEARQALTKALDAAGMTKPEPQVVGISDVRDDTYDVMVRFMVEVGAQWNAARFVRQRIITDLQEQEDLPTQVVNMVRVENA
jgi:small-conductance mechanosensitive channel